MNKHHARIGIVSPYRSLVQTCTIAAHDFSEPIWVALGLLDEGVRVAREMRYAGVEVIISRGGTAMQIMSSGIDVPVICIPIGGHDIARALRDAAALGGPIGVAEYPDMIASVASMADLMGVEVSTVPFRSSKEAGDAVLELLKAGVRVVIGETLTVQLATQYGAQGVLLQSGVESVRQAIREAIQTRGSAGARKVFDQQIAALAELVRTGVVLIDPSGRVQTANSAATALLGMSRAQLVGADAGWLLDPMAKTASSDISGDKQDALGILEGLAVQVTPLSLGETTCGWLVQLEPKDRRGKKAGGIRPIKTEFSATHRLSDIVGRSPVMRATLDMALRYARTDFAVLLCGETGTGKELLAQGIHNASPRATGPFVAVNCAGIPQTLLESELFGYENGAFTGAVRGGKPGLFQLASGGTIFLDEIESASLELQAGMLRVLEQGKVWPVGSDRAIPVDVRVISASNQDLYELMKQGRFREDLFYRLSTLMIRVPPLRDRREDIRDLANAFIKRTSTESGRPCVTLSDDAFRVLEEHDWPGNVRELLNVIRRLVVTVDAGVVTAQAVRAVLGPNCRSVAETASGQDSPERQPATPALSSSYWPGPADLETLEKEAILAALRESYWSKKEAARRLGISTTTLWRKLKKWSDFQSARKDCVS
ncbi:MAG TPA: sigma 54-interacting transcriptional regulator [Firmicutes bacterium]|nr:sigma 54-interacting transcriptional regulator [Bacillota bacterium]